MKRLARNLEEYVAATLMVIMVFAVFIGVFFRYVLNDPLQWAPELATSTFLWQVFLGTSIAAKRKAHIGVDLLTRLLPEVPRKILAGLIYLLSVGFLAVMIYYSTKFMLNSQGSKTLALEIPYAFIYLAIPVGLGLTMIRMLSEFAMLVRGEGVMSR